MKQVMIDRFGGIDEMKLVDAPVPQPAPGEVRVKIQAAGASYPDVAIRNGSYPEKITPPVTLGYDLAGVVDALGDAVMGFEIGQSIAALTMTGAYAEYAIVPADELIPVPSDIDSAVASLIPLNYLTAYQMLTRTANVQKGQTVLIHSAAGGVGTAMLEICRHLDVRALGTASAAKHNLIRSLGGEPIDYQTTDFVEADWRRWRRCCFRSHRWQSLLAIISSTQKRQACRRLRPEQHHRSPGAGHSGISEQCPIHCGDVPHTRAGREALSHSAAAQKPS